MVDLAIRNANIVTPETIVGACIAVDEGKIVSISTEANLPPSEKTIDAKGYLVFPGFIDVHVHFSSLVAKAVGYNTETRSAAFGGVTTVMDFVAPEAGVDMGTAIQKRLEAAKSSVVDFALHAVISQADSENYRNKIDQALNHGITSFKMFMAYKEQGWMMRNDALFDVFCYLTRRGGLGGVHAEEGDLVSYLDRKHRREGKTSPIYSSRAHPNLVEEIAANTALALAREAAAKLFLFHLSTEEALEAVRRAKKRGQSVWAETCPHYLLLTDKIVEQLGPFARVHPPLRPSKDVDALWSGLADQSIDVVSSDHSFLDSRFKRDGWQEYWKASPGLPGVETRVPLLYTEAVVNRGMSPCLLSKLMCVRPAEIFGIPWKGIIDVGFDADLVFLDIKKRKEIRADTLHSAADHTPFEGMSASGFPALTILRGKVICEDGEFQGKPGSGQYLFRKNIQKPYL